MVDLNSFARHIGKEPRDEPRGYQLRSIAQQNGITTEQARYLLRRLAAQRH